MSDFLQKPPQALPPTLDSLRQYNLISYILYVVSLFVGITMLAAIVMNYIKRDEARNTWMESHVEWQIKTFWQALIWGVIGTILTVVLVGFVILALVSVWYIYRVIKGLIVFLDNKPIGNGWF